MLSSGNYTDFTGNTMSGTWEVRDGLPIYFIRSYRAIIGFYRADIGWELSTEKYSVTTSKHQNYLRRAVA